MKSAVTLIIFLALTVQAGAHATYIGYSGAPGCRGHCSQSCHATRDYDPTITVIGFPASYEPNRQYTIAVAHQSGAAIANFNCSVRIGTGSTNSGVLAAGANTSTYSHTLETNGIHWTNINTNSGDFVWTAPTAGTGEVRLYMAGLQGTPTNGADTQIVIISQENVTSIDPAPNTPENFTLAQNYPNPFNSETIIQFTISKSGDMEFEIDNILGQEVYGMTKHFDNPGAYSIRWDGKDANGIDLPSGIYFYRLISDGFIQTRKMILMR